MLPIRTNRFLDGNALRNRLRHGQADGAFDFRADRFLDGDALRHRLSNR